MDLPPEKCLVVGHFNSHSTSSGYEETNRRGEEVEEWQVEIRLLLLNDPECPHTFYSCRWKTTSTPALALPLTIFPRKPQEKYFPSSVAAITGQWNWLSTYSTDHRTPRLFSGGTINGPNRRTTQDSLTPTTKIKKRRIRRSRDLLTVSLKAITKAASATIPRGARKN